MVIVGLTMVVAFCLGGCTASVANHPKATGRSKNSRDSDLSGRKTIPMSGSSSHQSHSQEGSNPKAIAPSTTYLAVTPTTGSSTATSFPSSLVTVEAVAQAWQNAEDAYDQAAYTDDWESPALAATNTSPQLEAAQNSLKFLKAADDYAVGNAKILGIQVLVTGRTTANVIGCVGGSEIEVNRHTGRPVPGDPGQDSVPDICDAQMLLKASGWLVETQSVEEGQCPVQ